MKNTVPSSASADLAARSAPCAVELMPPSLTVRLGKRRLTLSWRARKPLPALLDRLLLRSWRRVLAPVLRVSVAAAAVCGAWQAPALAAAPAPGTLPIGWSVVNGNVVFTQNGNTLNINQLSPQAIANFQSFSIGSSAVVNISQPSSAAAFLAKVTGGDISQIYGKLTAPGLVALYNPNGILIGPGGTVDVNRFIATTLNINDSDFLAGKLTFSRQGSTAGTVENQGTIKAATGGSVYLIGSSVTNGGVISSPRGEVILAAGETVTLADTATPGVTVAVTGSSGSVTNLGSITAEAGRIGIAAGLISNSGSISASSVVREGGRIFLRASQNLTTTATSSISAAGTAGGNVTLYAENKAFIDGDVSATGAPGHGGFVETSGLKQLDVVKVPTVGSGGTWLIDPYDLTVVSSSSSPISGGMCGTVYAVGSSDGGTEILNSTINAQLNQGINVTLTTGNGGNSAAGNITVSADIVKSAGAAANLTLNADNDININANITSTSNGLDLALSTRHNDFSNVVTVSRDISVNNGARVVLNGGTMTVSDGGGKQGNGTLLLSNGTVALGTGGTLNAGDVTVNSGSLLNLGSAGSVGVSSLTNNGTVSGNGTITTMAGGLANNGTISVNGTISTSGSFANNGMVAVNGTISTAAGFVNNGTLAPGGDGSVGTLNISGDLTFGSNSKLLLDFSSAGNDKINLLTCSTVSLGGTLSTRLLNGYTASVGTAYQVFNMTVGAQFGAGSYFRNVTGDVLTVGGAKQMIKATNASGLTLAMTGAETLTVSSPDASWDSLSTWGSAGYIPTAIDTVVVNSGASLQHGFGADTIDKLVLNGGTLGVYGGNLTVATSASGSGNITLSSTSEIIGATTTLTLNNAVTDANLTVSSGNLAFGGNARFSSLLMGSGNITGSAGSRLNVSDSFIQAGGNMTLADAALSQASGPLMAGNITADNLVLEAQGGNIVQLSGASLHVKKQLITSSVTGTTLTNDGNQIAAFAANNKGVGDITLINALNPADASVVTLNGISNANGNINVDNTGGMATAALGSNADFLGNLPSNANGTAVGTAAKLATLGIGSSGQVNTANGSVSLATHSPLTIGSGGVSASGGITLTAGTLSGNSTDNLTINGLLSSQGGNITLTAGNVININANISTLLPGLVPTPSAPIVNYAPGVTITDANGVRMPVLPLPSVDSSPVPVAPIQQAANTVINTINSVITTSGTSSSSSSTADVQHKDEGKHDNVLEEKVGSKPSANPKMYCS
ncbi:filamentous hemagglutinin N-terminal domain-containing protein [Herbaspirillum sp.]|uniref:beta strand repeat-containing protein n=1 Tax=Herbaspirillum sp. TaxID=1890675 RepID=UPI001B0B4C41|nr:filamentous hemagglutinin N-terminal domain-containing protein [Herbaspirillum sp.]MBO9536792.1 filamentous hemagglutinin N-terminal domain-containing protein [Herbaspirillum sp.]